VGRRAAVAAAAVALGCVACGHQAAARPSGCVRVFFDGRDEGVTTPAHIRAVREHLAAMDDKIISLRFVSKAEALARMKSRRPYFVVICLPYNPFPASFEATPGSVDDAHAIVDALTPRPRGVHLVKYSRSPPHC
jgi:cell division protein FtsX